MRFLGRLLKMLSQRQRERSPGNAPGFPTTGAPPSAPLESKRSFPSIEHHRLARERHDDEADADTAYNLGLAHATGGHWDAAADCFASAAVARPGFAEAHYQLGLIAKRRGDCAAAAKHFGRAAEIRPDYAEAHEGMGAVAASTGQPEKAAAAFRRALEIKPDCAQYLSKLGYVLAHDLGEFELGASHIRSALELDQHDAGIWLNYCYILLGEDRSDEIIAISSQLLEARPDMHEARLNRAIALLKQGRFGEAWPDYEARKLLQAGGVPRPYSFPEWRGEDLGDKNLLVYAEQGLGDEIMFYSCLPDLIERARVCVIKCAPRLKPLVSRSFPRAVVHGAEQADRDTAWLENVPVDFQVAAGSLPGFFRKDWRDFPRHGGYLYAHPPRVGHWKQRLDGLGRGLKIGISWRGGMVSTRRDLRSLELSKLAPLLKLRGCHFVSLQYDAGEAEIAAAASEHGFTLQYWPEAINDYDETAALVAALDLVISVCTAVVHLAGALGRTAWVLVPAVAEWRYFSSGQSMPWYPSLRLFRQRQLRAWEPVLSEVAAELAAME